MSSVLEVRLHARISPRAEGAVGLVGRAPVVLSLAAAVVALAASVASLAWPHLLRGPAAMNGSLEGTALVLVVVTLPVLLASMWLVEQGATLALLGWLGALASIAYQGVLFAYATPFNPLFFLYVGTLACGLWGLVVMAARTPVDRLAAAIGADPPRRLVAGWLLLNMAAFLVLWLKATVPAVLSSDPPEFLVGTGMTTGVGQVLDLGFTLPVMVVAAVLLLQRRPIGSVLTGALLVMLTIETLSIGVDQWLGSAADPQSTVVSAALVPVFAVMTVLGLAVTVLFLRGAGWERSRSRDAHPVRG
jgi:hypothetical protein